MPPSIKSAPPATVLSASGTDAIKPAPAADSTTTVAATDSAASAEGDGFDRRHPLYVGDWKRSIPYVDEPKPAQDDLDEPHIKRKNAILIAHPEIAKLYGYDIWTFYITILAAAAQVGMAYVFGRVLVDWNWTMLLVAYAYGGTVTAIYGVIIHEATHSLTHADPFMNRMCGLIANIGIPVPMAMSFRRHHLEHHTYQGVTGKDPDLPLEWEYDLIKGNPIKKLIWMFFYPVMYVFRGAAQGKMLTTWELINWAFTAATDALVYIYCGPRGLLYLFISLWLGYSIHPGAAHFIQEHYTFDDGQETYSYYGSGNTLMMNIGYHNEHHDFLRIPWSRLPEVRRLAPEFYDTLKYHTSWFAVLWYFITDTVLGPQSRVARSYEDHTKARKMVRQLKEQVIAKFAAAKAAKLAQAEATATNAKTE